MKIYNTSFLIRTVKKKSTKAFTLVEVIISMAIFSIIVVSIIGIYIAGSDTTMKSDINRMMQENIKNVVEKIAEDVRKNGIKGVSSTNIPSCSNPTGSNLYKSGTILCTNSNNYYLAKKNISTGEYLLATIADCSGILDTCVIAKGIDEPLTNSFVSIKELSFNVSKDYIPKVTINIVMQPSINKGIKSDLIKESKLIFQTTISERPF